VIDSEGISPLMCGFGLLVVGPRELRGLSHDSLWLLVQSACTMSRTELKLLYVCLSKAHELYSDGQGILSLEAHQRIKYGAVTGKVIKMLD